MSIKDTIQQRFWEYYGKVQLIHKTSYLTTELCELRCELSKMLKLKNVSKTRFVARTLKCYNICNIKRGKKLFSIVSFFKETKICSLRQTS